MTFPDLLSAVRHDKQDRGIDLPLAFYDGAHFIEKPNTVVVLSGIETLGHAMPILPGDGESTLVIMPPSNHVDPSAMDKEKP